MNRILRILFYLVSLFALLSFFSKDFREIPSRLRFVTVEIPISGTGSMYPTFDKGKGDTDAQRSEEIVAKAHMYPYPGGIRVGSKSFFEYPVGRGDIVVIDNAKTSKISVEKYGKEKGFVKRVIAVGGDTLEFRDGFVYRNGALLAEGYTAKPRSTYGSDTVPDCQKITVPSNDVFVLGDNRKASLDSRFDLGMVALSDISYVLPWDKQTIYHSLWRNPTNDEKLANTPTLDPDKFIDLINKKRSEKNLKPLKKNLNLSESSKIRGNAMIKGDDFSIEATRSAITLKKSIDLSGYSNIVFGEVYSRGYYEADELIENFFEFPDTIKLLMSKEYDDIGVDTAIGAIHGCPSQVAVVHLGGYVPPNYKKADIDSWGSLVNQLNEVIPTWEAAKGADRLDKNKLQIVLNLFYKRLDTAQKVYNRMKANEYLTVSEQKAVEEDKANANELSRLTEEMLRQ